MVPEETSSPSTTTQLDALPLTPVPVVYVLYEDDGTRAR